MSLFLSTLLNSHVSGVYQLNSTAAVAQLRAAIEAQGWHCFHIDGIHVHDKRSFLDAVGQACAFPPYVGHNWDALEEALNDLSWIDGERSGFLFLLTNMRVFATRYPGEWATARSIFEQATQLWQELGESCIVLFYDTTDQ